MQSLLFGGKNVRVHYVRFTGAAFNCNLFILGAELVCILSTTSSAEVTRSDFV